MRKITISGMLIALGLLSLPVIAQEKPQVRKAFGRTISKINPENGSIRCLSSEYEASLQAKDHSRATTAAFETWLAPKIAEAKAMRAASGHSESPAIVITIPVVVHVIHNGDAVGMGENIADARVLSQITVLNQDFRRMTGTPGFNSNPVGADVEIQFCLAQTDPDGAPTTGINRVNLGIAQFATSAQVEGTLKPSTQWDPNRYFNIWVCQFSNSFSAELYGVLGYAQFPSDSTLGGLNVNGGAANTDGVIIDYRCFGSKTLANIGTYMADYDKGRTATHEIGHCFGLRHIWGDSDVCADDDFCADTPQAATEHYGCETGSNTCTSNAGNDMVENYMDYSDDSCMNIFTQNQKDRMLAVMQFSPRRASLATSTACNVAQVFQNDGSLTIPNLNISGCGTSFSPTLLLKNMGTATMTSASINYNVDGGASQTFNWNGTLATGASADVVLPAVTTTPGSHVLNVSLASSNGIADPYTDNSNKQIAFTIAAQYNTTQVLFTLQRDIYGSETTWNLKNSAGVTVYSGGPYTDTAALPAVLTQTWTVVNNECYTFTINDAYGDGICCDYGSGFYTLKTAADVTIASGGGFGASEQSKFGITSLSSPAFEMLSQLSLYPNPASAAISIATGNDMPENYAVYNVMGQLVGQRNISSSADLTIATASYPAGVYFIKLSKDGESRTLQFIKK